jgi:hypothetical protein
MNSLGEKISSKQDSLYEIKAKIRDIESSLWFLSNYASTIINSRCFLYKKISKNIYYTIYENLKKIFFDKYYIITIIKTILILKYLLCTI